MAQINIKDNSGDKDFFTIIPNYILNNSTHWDREVYIQMKRIAGEDGKCYMSIPKLAKKCGMGKERLKKSIDYLIKHKWIKFLGKTPIMTKGGEQFANTYTIEDIWKLNTEHYKGGSPQGYPQDKGGVQEVSKGGRQIVKGGSCHACKEEPFKEEPLEEDMQDLSCGTEINLLLEEFKEVNPSYERLFKNTTQRSALDRLIKKYTAAKVKRMINALPVTNSNRYAPTITTPLQLEQKLGQLIAFIKRENTKETKGITL